MVQLAPHQPGEVSDRVLPSFADLRAEHVLVWVAAVFAVSAVGLLGTQVAVPLAGLAAGQGLGSAEAQVVV